MFVILRTWLVSRTLVHKSRVVDLIFTSPNGHNGQDMNNFMSYSKTTTNSILIFTTTLNG